MIKLLRSLFGAKPAVRARPRSTQTPRQHWISNPWHAVSIVPCTRCCQAAKNASHQRYLSAEAPVLPLAICDLGPCTCHYRHHPDRRSTLRRNSDVAASRVDWPGRERRGARGRRFTDQ